MFKEDRQEDQLLVAPEQMSTKRLEPAVVAGTAAAAVKMTVKATVVPIEVPAPAEVVEVVNEVPIRTLRDLLYEQEPWAKEVAGGSSLTPGIRRLMEKRINRTLTVVADWMLSNVEQRVGDEMTLVVLLELAETVREQIVWPERDAFQAQESEQ